VAARFPFNAVSEARQVALSLEDMSLENNRFFHIFAEQVKPIIVLHGSAHIALGNMGRDSWNIQ
jgi:hypothetical protein